MKAGALIELLSGLDPDTLVAIPCDNGSDPRGQMVVDVMNVESPSGRAKVVKLVGLLDLDLISDERLSPIRRGDVPVYVAP